MKPISILYFILFNLSIFSCAQEKKPNKNYQEMFTEFISKEKFNKDEVLLYPCLKDNSLKYSLTNEINRIAETFKLIQTSKKNAEKFYQIAIEIGIKSISNYGLDTEDRTRVANYIEELMDIVELESSNGILNNYVYGFDPTKK